MDSLVPNERKIVSSKYNSHNFDFSHNNVNIKVYQI
jgi:hypothetical protein